MEQMSKCQNASCPFYGECESTICERYTDINPNESVTITPATTNTSDDIYITFYKNLPDGTSYINNTEVGKYLKILYERIIGEKS